MIAFAGTAHQELVTTSRAAEPATRPQGQTSWQAELFKASDLYSPFLF